MIKKISQLVFALVLLPILSVNAQVVYPMLKTKWGQGYPYNALCPKDSTGEQMLAGCGPIAMAQVLEFLGKRTGTVEELIRDCGFSAFTRYGRDASGTRSRMVLNAMKFSYSCSPYMNGLYKIDYIGKEGMLEWKKIIMNELLHGRPVIMSSDTQDGTGGHTFVIDGVADTLVHVNFGWNGKRNGYYPLERLGEYVKHKMAIVDIGDSSYIPQIDTIRLDKAGTLRTQRTDEQWNSMRHLKVVGPVNLDDMKWLRELTGYNREKGRLEHLKTIDLQETDLVYLPDSLFMKRHGISYVRLPKGLKVIGRDAFKGCRDLNYVEIPPSVDKIRMDAFAECRQLIDIHFPKHVTKVLSYSFRSDEYLTKVCLPENIDTIGAGVFMDCERLEYLYIPSSVVLIGPNIVQGCPFVKIEIDANNPKYEVRNGVICYKKTKCPIDEPIPWNRNKNNVGNGGVRKAKVVKGNLKKAKA